MPSYIINNYTQNENTKPRILYIIIVISGNVYGRKKKQIRYDLICADFIDIADFLSAKL